MKGTLVFVDLETTGLDRLNDEIIEVGLVRCCDGEVTATWSSLVRPERALPRRVASLTGITDADLAHQPSWAMVREEVRRFLGCDPLVGHNVAFDYAFLERLAGYRADMLLDTCALARMIIPTAASYRLEYLCQLFGVERNVEHRALDDAKATARVFLALEQCLRALPTPLLVSIRDVLRRGLSPWMQLVEDSLVNQAGSVIVPAGVMKAVATDNRTEEVTIDPMAGSLPDPLAVLGEGGRLARLFPGYEYREGQVAMASAVQETLLEDGYLLAEAGTGTGKSLAYLVPAAVWALNHGQRVVVSTHTVNLQEQLLAKDIPLVCRLLERPLRAVVLKGRRHYLCRRRWEQVRREPSPSAEKAQFIARLHVWLAQTSTGDCAELGLRPEERGYWVEVAAEREGCAGNACRYQNSCFLRRARRAAEDAQLIVTNHALLLSEIQSENGVLPEYGPLIIDEAHHLEDVATEQLGVNVGYHEWELWRQGVQRALGQVAEAWPGVVKPEALGGQASVRQAGERFFGCFRAQEQWAGDEREAMLGPGGDSWPGNDVASAYLDLNSATDVFLTAVDQVLENVAARGALTDEASENLALQEERGRKLAADLDFIFRGEDPDYVSWVVRGAGDELVLRAAPVEAGRLLYEGLLAEKRPVVLTSATLTVGRSFAFFAGRVGLDRLPQHMVRTKRVASPFDYDRQVWASVVSDLPDPGAGGGPSYVSAVVDALERLIIQAQGGTLVLFTAHKLLREAYIKLKPRLEAGNIDLLGHGVDGSRRRILEAFQTTERAVLFGSASFWEGVDLPGQILRCLIIVKLPFAPPNHPVTVTRAARLEAQGRNPFSELALPQAVIRFRQGFGRLIRTRRDRGVVIVLDRRVVEKRYGIQFLHSLPVCGWQVQTLDEACAGMARWFQAGESDG